jgi:hypothetical protein
MSARTISVQVPAGRSLEVYPIDEEGDMRFNIAARAGRWSADHWKTAVTAWLRFCVVAIALGSVAGMKIAPVFFARSRADCGSFLRT